MTGLRSRATGSKRASGGGGSHLGLSADIAPYASYDASETEVLNGKSVLVPLPHGLDRNT